MSTHFEKLRKNNFLFALMFIGLSLAPVFLKFVATRSVGPTFNFYFFIGWIPLVSLSFALLKGWRESAITGILILCAILVSLVSYPIDPPMDFRRQIVHQSEALIVLAALVSLSLQLMLPRKGRT